MIIAGVPLDNVLSPPLEVSIIPLSVESCGDEIFIIMGGYLCIFQFSFLACLAFSSGPGARPRLCYLHMFEIGNRNPNRCQIM